MSTVYIVTDGSYSDYRIVAVFDNKEQAEALANGGGHNPKVEEYELNPEYVDYAAQGYRRFYIQMSDDGTVIQSRQENDDLYVEPSYFHNYQNSARVTDNVWLRLQDNAKWKSLAPGGMYLDARIIAKSEEQATKVTNEKRIQLLAEGRWKEGEQL